LAIKIAALEASDAEHRASRKTKEEAERRVAAMEKSMRTVPGSVSNDDYQAAILTVRRYHGEEIAHAAAVKVQQAELEKAKTAVEMQQIRSGVRGVVKAIYKERGDAVKALEAIFAVEVPDKPRLATPASGSEKMREVCGLRDGILVLHRRLR